MYCELREAKWIQIKKKKNLFPLSLRHTSFLDWLVPFLNYSTVSQHRASNPPGCNGDKSKYAQAACAVLQQLGMDKICIGLCLLHHQPDDAGAGEYPAAATTGGYSATDGSRMRWTGFWITYASFSAISGPGKQVWIGGSGLFCRARMTSSDGRPSE